MLNNKVDFLDEYIKLKRNKKEKIIYYSNIELIRLKVPKKKDKYKNIYIINIFLDNERPINIKFTIDEFSANTLIQFLKTLGEKFIVDIYNNEVDGGD